MDEGNVWSPGGEADSKGVPFFSGGGRYGEGLWVNQAFSLECVVRTGIALLREQPLLLLSCAAALWLTQFLPAIAAIPLDVASAVLEGTQDPSAPFVRLAANLVSTSLQLVLMPVWWLLYTGGLRAVSRYLQTDEVRFRDLYASLWPTGMVIVNRFLVGLIVLATLALLAVPLGVLAALLFWSGIDLFLTIVLLAVAGSLALVVYLWVALPLLLCVPAIALDECGPLEALGVAWTAGHGARVTLFVLGLVYWIASLLGCAFLFVGMIPVIAVSIGGFSAAWLLYARPEKETTRWPFFERNPLPWT